MYKIFALIGISGSGKSTIAKSLSIPEMKSTTTRKKRVGETGNEYNFINKHDFIYKDKIKKDFIEKTEYNGNYYGLDRNVVEHTINQSDSIVVVDANGVIQLKALYGDLVTVIYVDVSEETAFTRMISRGNTYEEAKKRIEHARETGEFDNGCLADFIVDNNDKLEDTIDAVNKIVRPNIWIDVDGVLFNSIERFVSLYNLEYNDNADYTKVRTWNFEGVCNKLDKLEQIEKLFEHKDFYHKDYIKTNNNAIEFINKIKELNANVRFLTIGRVNNCIGKLKLISEIFPNTDIVTYSMNNVKMDKSIIKMGASDIIIDDNCKNLKSSKAGYKLLFQEDGVEMDFNKDWNGLRMNNWEETYNFVKGVVA